MPGKVWDEITYPFLNFNGCTMLVKGATALISLASCHQLIMAQWHKWRHIYGLAVAWVMSSRLLFLWLCKYHFDNDQRNIVYDRILHTFPLLKKQTNTGTGFSATYGLMISKSPPCVIIKNKQTRGLDSAQHMVSWYQSHHPVLSLSPAITKWWCF